MFLIIAGERTRIDKYVITLRSFNVSDKHKMISTMVKFEEVVRSRKVMDRKYNDQKEN